MRFWEFDRFGEIKTGSLRLEKTRVHYDYEYVVSDNTIRLRDTWRPIDEDTYEFTVIRRETGSDDAVLLRTTFRRMGK